MAINTSSALLLPARHRADVYARAERMPPRLFRGFPLRECLLAVTAIGTILSVMPNPVINFILSHSLRSLRIQFAEAGGLKSHLHLKLSTEEKTAGGLRFRAVPKSFHRFRSSQR